METIDVTLFLDCVRSPTLRTIYKAALELPPNGSTTIETPEPYRSKNGGVESLRRTVTTWILRASRRHPELEGRRYYTHCSLSAPETLTIRRIE